MSNSQFNKVVSVIDELVLFLAQRLLVPYIIEIESMRFR